MRLFSEGAETIWVSTTCAEYRFSEIKLSLSHFSKFCDMRLLESISASSRMSSGARLGARPCSTGEVRPYYLYGVSYLRLT